MTPLPTDSEIREALARAIHEDYVARAVQRGETPGSRRELSAWDELPNELREANRRQTDDIPTKLEAIGADVVDADLADDEFSFSPAELDLLARHEHDRWMRERLDAGWTYGPEKDASVRTHPCLMHFDELAEEDREKDRDAVRRIPRLLGRLGLGIVRRES